MLWTRGKKRGAAKLIFFSHRPFVLGFHFLLFSFFWRFLSQCNSVENGMCLQGKRAGNSLGRRRKEVDMCDKVGCICKGGQTVCGMGRRQDSAGGGVCEAH